MTQPDPITLRARVVAWLRARAAGLCLVVVVVGALVLRVDSALRVEYPTVDGVHYMHTARDLSREGSLPLSSFPPGWPLLIHASLRIHGSDAPTDLLLTAQASNVALGTLAGVLLFVLVRRHVGRWWALLAAAIFLALPETITSSSSDLSESSYLVALLGAWLVFERRPSWLAGLLFGFAYLVRPEALLVFAALCVHASVRHRRILFAAALGCLVFVVPYVVFLHGATGSWMLSSKHAFLEAAVDERSVVELVQQWSGNFWDLLQPLSGIIGGPLVALAVVGAVVHRGRTLYAFLPLLLLPVFTFRMEARYWIPLLPFVFLYATLGVRAAIDRWPRARRPVTAALVLLMLGGAARAMHEDWRFFGASYEYYPGMRKAGMWLGSQIEPGQAVLDYKPYVAFWAGTSFRKLPRDRDARGIVDWARENRLDYLVVNEHLVASLTPELAPLWDELPESLERKLTLVHVATIEGQPRQTTKVFRVEPVGKRWAARDGQP